jgi:hypothetical protein
MCNLKAASFSDPSSYWDQEFPFVELGTIMPEMESFSRNHDFSHPSHGSHRDGVRAPVFSARASVNGTRQVLDTLIATSCAAIPYLSM